MTLAAVAKQMYEAARAMGYGRNDYTAVVRPLENWPASRCARRRSPPAIVGDAWTVPGGAGAPWQQEMEAAMNDEGQAMQWLVRTLGRQAGGEATLATLRAADRRLSVDDLTRLVRRSAAMGLVAYRGADGDDGTRVWLTAQGDQALGSLDALDDAQR